MLVRGTELWYGVELGMEAFIAPTNFDANAQEVNIYSVFSRFYQANTDAAYGFAFTSAIATLSLGVVVNRTYIWGETLADGTEYISGQVASATAFTAGTTKRFVIVFDSTTSDGLTLNAPSGSTWLYVRKGSTIQSITSSYLKYIHFDKLSTITTINSNAALNNTSLTGNLYIPDSVTSIAASAFSGCTGLNGTLRITKNPTFTTINTKVFFNCKFTGELDIPSNVITIADNIGTNEGAFHGCTGFTSLKLNEGLIFIGKYSFYGCSGMVGQLVIPSTVSNIRGAAFNNTSFTGDFVIPPTVTTLIGAAINGSGVGIFVISTLTSVAIHPNSILQYIGIGAFYTTKLRGSLVIPNTVTFIGNDAFNGCTGLNGSLSIGTNSSLTTIPIKAFYNCRFTGTLTIPDNITTVQGTAGTPAFSPFGGGNVFTRIVLGTGLTSASHYSFDTNYPFNNIVTRVDAYRMTAPSVQITTFNGRGTTKPVLHIPADSTSYTTSPWTSTTYFSSIVADL